MLTSACYRTLAALLAGRLEPPALTVAVGAGAAGWDAAAPEPDRDVDRLVAEVARRRVAPEDLVFLDEAERPTEGPTPVLRLAVTFGPEEAVGTLRECGLFAALGDEEVLLAYYVHPRLEKRPDAELERTIRLDLTPRAVAPGSRVTRWLGNTHSRELHDLDRETPNCQVAEIAEDRRFYFGSEAAARERGYDPCAYCFGPDQSER